MPTRTKVTMVTCYQRNGLYLHSLFQPPPKYPPAEIIQSLHGVAVAMFSEQTDQSKAIILKYWPTIG